MSTAQRKARLIGLVIGAAVVVTAAIALAGLHIVRSGLNSTESIDGGALVSSDGRTVSVMGVGACDWSNMHLTAAEQPGSVVLTLRYTRPLQDTCSGMPGYAAYHTQLQAPLGHRRLVDGVTGKAVPYFDSRHLLRPAYLPLGYQFRYDAPSATGLLSYDYQAAPEGATVSCSQLYSRAGGPDLLVITQATGGRLTWPTQVRPQPVIVHGHQALAIPGRLSWTQGGQTIVVAATDPDLPESELVSVAASLS